MKAEWKIFLEDAGAEFDKQTLVSFGNIERERRAALGGDVMCELSRYKILAVVGEDAKTFLQGQAINDTSLLDDNHSQLSGFCTPKGRLISNFRLFEQETSLFAIIPETLFETTLNKLNLYVLRAKVQLGDASNALIQMGVSGEKAEDQLKDHIGSLPENVNDVFQKDNIIAIKIAEHRYHLLSDFENCKTLWNHLDVHCTPVGNQHWELLNIRDGLPEITENTTEAFIPQMINMGELGAISFTKGCYTGQEIVARTHYLGKQKRRMYRLLINSDTAPEAGDDLATDTSTDSQYIGTIVSAQPDAANGYQALAVVQINSAETEKLHLKHIESEIEILELPYSFEEKK